MILVFRCANGVVAYWIRKVSLTAAQATCVNDKTTIALGRSFDATWIAAFTAMGQHAVSLRGNIIETIVLPSMVA